MFLCLCKIFVWTTQAVWRSIYLKLINNKNNNVKELIKDFFAGYGELIAALQRLQNELSKQGMAALASRVTAAQQLLSGPNIARALAIRAAVLQRRRPRIHNPVCSNAQSLAKDVSYPFLTISRFLVEFNDFSFVLKTVHRIVGTIKFTGCNRIM